MKRDMELIRRMLKDVEAHDGSGALQTGDRNEAYHVALMTEAGLIDAHVTEDNSGLPYLATIFRLTWAGHDFLDASRDDTLWRKAVDKVVKPGASWTFGLLVEWLKQEARQKLFGLPPDAAQ